MGRTSPCSPRSQVARKAPPCPAVGVVSPCTRPRQATSSLVVWPEKKPPASPERPAHTPRIRATRSSSTPRMFAFVEMSTTLSRRGPIGATPPEDQQRECKGQGTFTAGRRLAHPAIGQPMHPSLPPRTPGRYLVGAAGRDECPPPAERPAGRCPAEQSSVGTNAPRRRRCPLNVSGAPRQQNDPPGVVPPSNARSARTPHADAAVPSTIPVPPASRTTRRALSRRAMLGRHERPTPTPLSPQRFLFFFLFRGLVKSPKSSCTSAPSCG
jgi:hypothetical protein